MLQALHWDLMTQGQHDTSALAWGTGGIPVRWGQTFHKGVAKTFPEEIMTNTEERSFRVLAERGGTKGRNDPSKEGQCCWGYRLLWPLGSHCEVSGSAPVGCIRVTIPGLHSFCHGVPSSLQGILSLALWTRNSWLLCCLLSCSFSAFHSWQMAIPWTWSFSLTFSYLNSPFP